jgi:hypothetical protein
MPDAIASSTTFTSAHANRHAWGLKKYGHLLAEALRKDTSAEARAVEKLPEEQIPGRIVTLILDKADPSQNKSMTAWLVRQYADGNLRLEDLGTANETLTMFRRYAQRLEKSQRDLGRYLSLAAVWEAVICFAQAEDQHLSGKAQKALDRDKAYTESRILRQDPDGFTIAVPMTEFAAKWWGRGTRWCTAAEKDNRFGQYHEEAPLIVVVIPALNEKGKFQIWASKRSVQFMDAADNPVSEILIIEYWRRFEPVIFFSLRQNGRALHYVPDDLRTEELWRIAVAQDGEALEYVPEHLRTDEFCRFAVAQDGGALVHVPKKLRTDEMCRIAVAQNGWALDYVPEALRTEEMCRIAVAQNGWALRDVPQKLCTEEMCRIAVAQDGLAFEYVPWSLRTEEMCRIAVAQNGQALVHVPKELRTEAICRIAVDQNGGALYLVPENLRKDEMCRIAVAKIGGALRYVPWDLRTEDLCRIAVAQNGWALGHVPTQLRTEELCRIAVAQDGEALQNVPEDLRTEEICKIAVEQNGRSLEHVPGTLRDRISALIPPPIPAWDISLLDELVNLLDATSSPAPLGSLYA